VAGAYKRCVIAKAPMSAGYILMVDGKNNDLNACLSAERGEGARVFKSLDAAASAAKQVGFNDVYVSLH